MITPITTPISTKVVLPSLSDADQKKFDTVKANLQSALDAIKNSKVDTGAAKRADAERRIAQIKASIKALQQLHGLDAKALAHQIAILAKELASAVKEYVSAGGSDSSVTAATSAGVPAASSSAPTDGSAQPAAAPADSSVATTNAPPAAAPVDTSTPAGSAANAYAQTQQTTTPAVANHDAEDQQFLKDVNDIKTILQGYAKQVRNALKSKFMPENLDPNMKDVRAIDSALDEVDRSLASLHPGS